MGIPHFQTQQPRGLISAISVMTDEPMLRHRIYQKKQNHAESSKTKDVVLSTILAVSNHGNTKMSNHTNI